VANDEVVIDLQNYKDRVGTRVVPGRYRVRVDDAELDKTKDGAPMINVWLVVQGGDFEGGTVIDRLLPNHPKALFRVVGFMQAIGLATPKKRLRVNIAAFIGKQLDVDIEDGEPYNGRVKSEIRGYYRIERGTAAPADLDDLPSEPAPEPEPAIDPLDLPEDLPDAQQIAEMEQMDDQQPAAQVIEREIAGAPAVEEDFEVVDLENLDLG
jgi:hypothetical protein